MKPAINLCSKSNVENENLLWNLITDDEGCIDENTMVRKCKARLQRGLLENKNQKSLEITNFPSILFSMESLSYLSQLFEDMQGVWVLFDGFFENVLHHNYYNKEIKITGDQCLNICQSTIGQSNTLIWKYERNKRITASDCYSLYTYTKSKKQNWSVKIFNYFKPKPANLKKIKIGIENEEPAVTLYKKITKFIVNKLGLITQPSCPWIGMSPDGLVIEQGILLEVKCLVNTKNIPLEKAVNDAIYTTSYNNDNNSEWYHWKKNSLKKNHKYYAQVQIGMYLLNVQTCDFLIFNYKDGSCAIISVPYDREYTKNIIYSLHPVYFKYVLPFIFENFVTEKDKV